MPSFGNVRKLPSGRYQARWRRGGKAFSARTADNLPLTFATEQHARDWLRMNAEMIRTGSQPVEASSLLEQVADLRREVADLRTELAVYRRWDLSAEELRDWLHEFDISGA